MKHIMIKMFGVAMTFFAVSQMAHTEKAQAATLETSVKTTSPFETTTHGNGCGCASCMPSAEISTPDDPA